MLIYMIANLLSNNLFSLNSHGDHSEKQGSVGAVSRASANSGPSESSSGMGSQALPTSLYHICLQQATRPDPLTVGQME